MFMSLKRYLDGNWINIKNVKLQNQSIMTDIKAVKRWDGIDWIDVWPNSKLRGLDLGRNLTFELTQYAYGTSYPPSMEGSYFTTAVNTPNFTFSATSSTNGDHDLKGCKSLSIGAKYVTNFLKNGAKSSTLKVQASYRGNDGIVITFGTMVCYSNSNHLMEQANFSIVLSEIETIITQNKPLYEKGILDIIYTCSLVGGGSCTWGGVMYSVIAR